VLRARFDDSFVSGSGATAVTVPAGKRLPGTPERRLFGELLWTPKALPGFHSAIELVHSGALYVNDPNDDAAPAATVVNLRAGFAQMVAGWRLAELVRLENAADKRYAGSVIRQRCEQALFRTGAGSELDAVAHRPLRVPVRPYSQGGPRPTPSCPANTAWARADPAKSVAFCMGQCQLNAWIPVCARPSISACTSCVPS
jgi:hypothetical protein